MTPILILVALTLAGPQQSQAGGSIAGCVADKSGAALPGAEIVASAGDAKRKVVTSASGCYELRGLAAGAYSVTASLAGFVTGKRERVAVISEQVASSVNFALCLSVLAEIDWIVWPDLREAWSHADVIVHVRITGTGPADSDCPSGDFEHSVLIIEVLKGKETLPGNSAVTFVQPKWVSEPTPYPIGQEMVLFLVRTSRGFDRLSGPYFDFLFNGNRVTSFHSPVRTEGVKPAEFLSRLRTLAR